MSHLLDQFAALPGPEFWLSYVAVLSVPGPNMMLAGACAAAIGFRKALPVVLAIACGAATLATALHVVIGAALDDRLQSWLVPLGGALMLLVAFRILKMRWASALAGDGPRQVPRTDLLAAFVCGAANPATAMFFAGQFVARPYDPGPASAAMTFGCTILCCLVVLSAATSLLSAARVRQLVARHFVPIKVGCAICFLAFGGISIAAGLHRFAGHA